MERLDGKRVYIENLGCAKNQVDAEVMLNRLIEEGCQFVSNADEAHIVLVNTCAFIESARIESIEAFFALRKQYPNAKIIVTGCLSQRYGRELETALWEADGIFGNRDLKQIAGFLERVYAGERPVEMPPYAPVDQWYEKRSRLFNYPGSAYVKISEGCNHRCRYCAIPLIRGPLQSRPFASIIDECRRLVESGVREINLIAQDLAAYGTDVKGDQIRFLELLDSLASQPLDFFIRMLYIHPDAFPAELPSLVASHPNILPYFDIPFQHAHPNVLRRMGRKGDTDSYLSLLQKIRAVLPDATIRSTFLLGFPPEDESTYAELLRFVQAAQLDWVGSFVYSREEGTPAYRDMTDSAYRKSNKQAKRWQQELEEVQLPITQQRLQRFVGRQVDVLVEERLEAEHMAIGRTAHQAPEVDGLTLILGGEVVCGTVVRCTVTQVNGIDLEAVPLKGTC